MLWWGDRKILQAQTQSPVTLSEGEDYEKFGQIVRIHSMKREFNAELLLPPIPFTRLVHLVNIATNDIKGDGLSSWNNRSVHTTLSATDRSIMAMVLSGKIIALTKEILARRWGVWIIICKANT